MSTSKEKDGVGDRYEVVKGDAYLFHTKTLVTLIVLEGDGVHKYEDETGESKYIARTRLKKLSVVSRVEYTLPKKKEGAITLANVLETIKQGMCTTNLMGGCSRNRDKAGCGTCVFNGGPNTDRFYQMVMDMAEQGSDDG